MWTLKRGTRTYAGIVRQRESRYLGFPSRRDSSREHAGEAQHVAVETVCFLVSAENERYLHI